MKEPTMVHYKNGSVYRDENRRIAVVQKKQGLEITLTSCREKKKSRPLADTIERGDKYTSLQFAISDEAAYILAKIFQELALRKVTDTAIGLEGENPISPER